MPKSAARVPDYTATSSEVAYLGPSGTFSEAAAGRLVPKARVRLIPSLRAIGEALAASKSLNAVLPFESSDSGFVEETVRILCRPMPIFIAATLDLPVRFSLYRLPGDKARLVEVLSQPHALTQCETWISRKGVRATIVSSTAEGPAKVAAGALKGVGAIAASGQAALFGLDEIERDLQGPKPNRTRFLSVARTPLSLKVARRVFFAAVGAEALGRVLSARVWSAVCAAEIASVKAAKSLGGFSYVIHAEFGGSMPVRAIAQASRAKGVRLIGWLA